MKTFQEAKQRGYEIELHFVWIPDVREAIRRVRQRVIEGGHHVPAADVRRRFTRSIEHFLNDYASLADRWAFGITPRHRQNSSQILRRNLLSI